MNQTLQTIKVEQLLWQPDKKATPILKSIDTVFEKGHIYGILGPNGSGKSSLVRQLLQLRKKQSGTIHYDETEIEEISRANLAQVLSFLPQDHQRDVDFSVYEIVAMGREPYRKKFASLSKEDIRKIEEAIEVTNCSDMRDKSISVLSGGECQRVMIARTIAQDTEWVILDEPVSNLDIRYQADLMQLLENLNQKSNKTIITILHDINLAMRFCDRVILMKDGNIFAHGDVREALNKGNLKEVFDMEFQFIETNGRKEPIIVPIYEFGGYEK